MTLDRRDFVAGSTRALGAGWLALQLPWLASLAGCAREDARRGAPFTVLSPAEGQTLRAFAAQIIPTDDEPGAEEAGAVYFVDRALGTPFFADQLPALQAGLADLDARARSQDWFGGGFATLSSDRQIAVMREIEKDDFFDQARTLVLMGMFSDPSHGGNRDGTGWTLLAMEHQPMYQPPYGYYDAEYRRESKEHLA